MAKRSPPSQILSIARKRRPKRCSKQSTPSKRTKESWRSLCGSPKSPQAYRSSSHTCQQQIPPRPVSNQRSRLLSMSKPGRLRPASAPSPETWPSTKRRKALAALNRTTTCSRGASTRVRTSETPRLRLELKTETRTTPSRREQRKVGSLRRITRPVHLGLSLASSDLEGKFRSTPSGKTKPETSLRKM